VKICIYGAGASGGHFAVRLALAGHDVSVIARGEHLQAMQRNGLTLHTGGSTLKMPVHAVATPFELAPQDLVIVCTKATALRAIATQLAPLISNQTHVVFPQNGLPWWYPIGLPESHPVPPPVPIFAMAADFLKVLRPDQIFAGVIFSANRIDAPGVIENSSPDFNCLDIGAIAGTPPDHLRNTLRTAGLASRDVSDCRTAMWEKLVTNISGSVLGLVTQSPSSVWRLDPGLKEIFLRAAREAASIPAAHGFPLSLNFDSGSLLAPATGHKASILQDYELGRPMEVAEIVLAPLAFARSKGVATPTLDVLAALAVNMAVARGLFQDSESWQDFWP
jgi:2-dehydropantoate 2-reductase